MRAFTDLKSNVFTTKLDTCDICIQAKQKRSPFSSFGGLRSTRPLQLIHTDLLEVNIPSIGGKRYVLTFIDDFSRYAKLRFLAKKNEVFNALLQCIKESERELSLQVSCIRSDNGGEYQILQKHLQDMGIKWEVSTSYTPEMNGVAERYNGKLQEMCRTLLLESQLPKSFWAELLSTSNYLLNRTFHRTIKSIPFCKYFGKSSVSVEHYRTIGCKAFVLRNEVANKHFRNEKRKMDSRSKAMILIGYEESNGVYRLFDKEKKTIIRSRDVKFVEHEKGYDVIQINANNQEELSVKQVSFEEGYQYPNEDGIRSEENHEKLLDNKERVRTDSISKESVSERIESINEKDKSSSDFDIIVQSVPQGDYQLFHALVSQAESDSNAEPLTVEEAKQSTHWPEWRKAMESEYNSLISHKTWVNSELPEGRKIVKGKWVFKVKRDQYGRISRYKCRYVAKGFSQVKGLDYQETFSPTVKYVTVRIMIALSVQYDWNIDQIDYETAFLNGDLQEDIYIEEPEEFESSPRKVLKLKKALYGLKQTPREWNQKLDKMLKSINFKQCRVDSGLYYADIEEGNRMYITVFVDDLLCFYPKESDSAKMLKQKIKDGFKSKDLGECSYILGMHVIRDRVKGIIRISQRQYIMDLLKRFKMEDCKPVETPLNPGTTYVKTGMKSLPESKIFGDVKLYQKAIGSLIYLMISTRPDISFAVSHLARFMQQPREVHWQAVMRIFRYLQGTKDMDLIFQKDQKMKPIGYADASYAPDISDCRSIMGYLFIMSGSAVIWKTQKQVSVARSTCDAEFMALGHCASEAAWLRNLLNDILTNNTNTPIMICGDNQSSIKVSKHPVFHQRMKHVAVQYFYTRELINDNIIDLKFVSSKDMIADILTKGLGQSAHSECVRGLGLLKIDD